MRCYVCSDLHHPHVCPSKCPSCQRRLPGAKGSGPACDCDAARRIQAKARPAVLLARVKRVEVTVASATGT